MKKQFDDYKDILTYLAEQGTAQELKVINLQKSIFNFEINLDLLFHYLRANYREFDLLNFSDSIFRHPLNLYLTNQEPVYDKKNKLENFIHKKTEIDFAIDFSNCHFFDIFTFSRIEFCEDLNFIEAIFEKEVQFSELVLKKYLRIFNATFRSNVHFAYLELNSKSIFFTNNDNRARFEGNLYFSNVIFQEAKFWDFLFAKDIYFQNTIFNCPVFFNNSKFKGKIVFSSLETIGLTEFNNKVYFDNAEINELNFERITFDKAVSFNYAKINKISVDNVHCFGLPLSLVETKIKIVKDEGTARFLKTEAMKSNNPFLVAELIAKEMTMHYDGLKWRKHFFDKLIFLLNKSSTNFGEKWEKGVIFIFLVWTFSFSLLIMLRDGIGKTFIWSDKNYIKEAMNFLWQFGSLDILDNSYSWANILVFIIGKVLIIYGVYQTIAAFRKYGKK